MPLIFSPILASKTSFPATGRIVPEDWIVPQSPQPEDTLIRCVFPLVPRPLTISLLFLMESQVTCSVPLSWLLSLTWHHLHRPGNFLDISKGLQSPGNVCQSCCVSNLDPLQLQGRSQKPSDAGWWGIHCNCKVKAKNPAILAGENGQADRPHCACVGAPSSLALLACMFNC